MDPQSPAPHVYVLQRVGNVLLVYFALHVVSLLADLLFGQSHSFTLDLMSLILGLLLRNGSLGAARFTTFSYAFGLVTGAGAILAAVVMALLHVVPMPPLGGIGLSDALLIAWGIFWLVVEGAMSVWILRQLLDPAVEEALASSGRGSARNMVFWGGGVGVALLVLIIPVMVFVGRLLETERTQLQPQAAAAVEQRLGPGWQFEITAFSQGGGHWRAHVIAHRGSETRELDVGDQAR